MMNILWVWLYRFKNQETHFISLNPSIYSFLNPFILRALELCHSLEFNIMDVVPISQIPIDTNSLSKCSSRPSLTPGIRGTYFELSLLVDFS